ncbi:tripartite tricarboxylate transporter permease [Sporosarcina pasteurii]|uniref:Tripartite tricarboxylate transporter TctA family n=1 Tax=Sporosarcina pasteurii TaxID=1474 RepID=A0A380BLD6_SPOPA|nr:tripartite tricarboxylate transporter permease [Sporosarcina pasteurii]MDS9470923.1 tripartite tricarboxylate transporter permease [Sporosarcina pasteurii]SUJ03296.1 Tripartite tricarboxylate transporter TctA family [Sporosarcina pasteurii]
MIQELISGFATIMQPEHLFWCVVGITLGTLVGALPGVGPVTGIAILLPITFGMNPISALLLLMGIYQGSMYGGRISSVLLNVPGDSAAVVTTFDGYPLTQQGRAGYALTLSAVASFIGGVIGFIGLVFLAGPITGVALKFGAPEYFALMVFALIATSGLTEKKPFKPIVVMLLGLLIASVGVDPVAGTERFTFGVLALWKGINFVVVAVGLFGLSEVFVRMEERIDLQEVRKKIPFSDLFPKVSELIKDSWAMIRGSILGFFIGVLPGAGATIATFLTYDMEKKLSKEPEKFGKGASKGLSGPEAANNATVGGALIPLFSLGIPGSGTTAILLGALMMLGLQPGPLMFETSGNIIWAAIAGLFLANVLLLILNTAFVPLFAIAVQKAEPYLGPIIAAFCIIGAYMLNNSLFDVGLMITFGILGYILRKFGFPLAPLVLAVILGPILEDNFRQSLMMSGNEISIFYTRPITLTIFIITLIIVMLPIVRKLLKMRRRGISGV